MEFDTIVVGYDGSPCAEAALKTLPTVCNPDSKVHVVTAFHMPTSREISAMMAEVPDEFKSTINASSLPEGVIDDARFLCKKMDLEIEEHIVDDDAASAILDVAELTHADLIVVGSRGLGRASRFVRGSVSSKVASHARTSVLVIHD